MSNSGQFIHLFAQAVQHALLLLLTVQLELLLGVFKALVDGLVNVCQSLFEGLVVLLDGSVLRDDVGDLLLELTSFSDDRAQRVARRVAFHTQSLGLFGCEFWGRCVVSLLFGSTSHHLDADEHREQEKRNHQVLEQRVTLHAWLPELHADLLGRRRTRLLVSARVPA
ncbi:hypothetical protein ALP36_102562 [Pseudomonas syringae pv. coriandricola]|uniref:Uncharacterized protein n=1 Tax=Pseudomonas syringae pv. coriandricola TaxID=264453 RepID=A0A3M5R2M7_9PSED|nr:hypothetical protein ALP87_102489 [Pseudomonas syringae pv. coriandricola]RMU03038.1 hypothetical protein ALP36_102562 [Pseudomonas syringae pv. coriandricola]